jgi:hypothetical protein
MHLTYLRFSRPHRGQGLINQDMCGAYSIGPCSHAIIYATKGDDCKSVASKRGIAWIVAQTCDPPSDLNLLGLCYEHAAAASEATAPTRILKLGLHRDQNYHLPLLIDMLYLSLYIYIYIKIRR